MTPALQLPGSNIFTSAIEGITGIIAETGRVPPFCDVARCIGIAPEQLQIYFADEAALVDAMAENALLLLHHTLVEVLSKADPDDPVEQFIALGDAYVEWGFRYPREFRVTSLIPSSQFAANPRLMRYEQSIHELMTRIISRALEGQVPGGTDLNSFLSIAHTFSYGVVSKMLTGDLARWNPGLCNRDAARQTLRVFIHQFLRPVHQGAAGPN